MGLAMAFDFPAGATLGQIYTSADGIVYSWDGEKWMKGSATGVTTPPPFPAVPAEDGIALVTLSSAAVWGAPINAGSF